MKEMGEDKENLRLSYRNRLFHINLDNEAFFHFLYNLVLLKQFPYHNNVIHLNRSKIFGSYPAYR